MYARVVMEFHYLAGFLITQAILVIGDVQFLERYKGEEVVIPCVAEKKGNDSPIGLYVFRKWLKKDSQVLFMYTKDKPSYSSSEYSRRTRVSGDPSDYQLNVTISDLGAGDTDCYHCQFAYPEKGTDIKINSSTEFFLYVDETDLSGSLDVELVETCAGGSAVIPCPSLRGEGAEVGVSLKRRQGRGPVEVLYHSKQTTAGTIFPSERLQWAIVPGPSGMPINLTLLQLQPEDSAFYSCEILLADRPGSSSRLGKRVFFVSVQGDTCGCASYATLLYATTAAVGLLLVFLIVLGVHHVRSNANTHTKPQTNIPIYEEMVGMRSSKEKVPALHLEETDTTLHCNSAEKFRPVNHYETSPVAPSEELKE